MKIAIDAMGGDFAPEEIIKGAIEFLAEENIDLILVGDKEKIIHQISKYQNIKKIPFIIHAKDRVLMDDEPRIVLRKKKESSLGISFDLLKNNDVSAVVSAGNTGAMLAYSLFKIGRIKGINRPAIATLLPTIKGETILIDSGANVDCNAQNLLEFGKLGSLYSEITLGINSPRIGLLNIGEEEKKGNSLTKESFSLLKNSNLNFIGNVEGKDIPEGKADVVVCDGFVGNTILKFGEGVGSAIFTLLKDEIKKDFFAKFGALFLRKNFLQLKRKIDHNEYGGAPLLGVEKLVIITHGRAKSRTIKNAIRLAKKLQDMELIKKLCLKLS